MSMIKIIGVLAGIAGVVVAGNQSNRYLQKRKIIQDLGEQPNAAAIFPALDANSESVRRAFGIPPAQTPAPASDTAA